MDKTHTDRRTLIGAFAAAPLVALATTSALAAQGQTPIQALFRQWTQLLKDAHGISDDQCDAAVDHMLDIELQMAKEPVTCIADYAAKILAVTAYGVFGISGGQTGDAVLAEAKALMAGE
ncbi:MAG: hypothetical protein ACE1Y4_05140 [Lysobacterales bacterium]